MRMTILPKSSKKHHVIEHLYYKPSPIGPAPDHVTHCQPMRGQDCAETFAMFLP